MDLRLRDSRLHPRKDQQMTLPTTEPTMQHVSSADGTSIAYERTGTGPSLVLVDGAFCGVGFGPSRALAAELASSFTVTFYDRRGRGGSTDTQPYSVRRAIMVLEAVPAPPGGEDSVTAISSA